MLKVKRCLKEYDNLKNLIKDLILLNYTESSKDKNGLVYKYLGIYYTKLLLREYNGEECALVEGYFYVPNEAKNENNLKAANSFRTYIPLSMIEDFSENGIYKRVCDEKINEGWFVVDKMNRFD